MAFETANDVEAPTHTTVSGYKVSRLGNIPRLQVYYAETVEDGTNVFGLTAQRQTATGRQWELIFDADTPERIGAMGGMLVTIMLKIGRALLSRLGFSGDVTDAELLEAVMAMDNIDSFLASAMEDLEKDRRLGVGPALSVMGAAPGIHLPAPLP